MKKETRFEVILTESGSLRDEEEGFRQILVDKVTGVHYLTWKSAGAGGITPLLDTDGKPIIKK